MSLALFSKLTIALSLLDLDGFISNSLIISTDLLLDAPLSSQFHLLYFLQYCNFYLVPSQICSAILWFLMFC